MRPTDDASRIDAAILGVIETLGGKPSNAMLNGYHMALADLPVRAIERACEIALRTCKFVPRPVELRELAGQGTDEQRAMLAWEVAARSVGAIGSYKHVDFADGATNATIRNLGGWPTFCGRFTGAESEKWLRKEFLDAYRGLAHVTGEATKTLPGLSESSVVNGERAPAQIVCIAFDGTTTLTLGLASARQTDTPRLELQSP